MKTQEKEDQKYMRKCLQLAGNGFGMVAPNPMVGCVIVSNGKVIGEGFHQKYGDSHAEVKAIQSVSKKTSLKGSTLYVSLEPCSHHGKTPPCTNLIVKSEIGRVVIGAKDTNSEVTGSGKLKLEENGLEVVMGVLEKECREQNKRFFSHTDRKRPYVILKWAQTINGFISENRNKQTWITGPESIELVHKWRTEEQAILVGTNTALVDNPRLTARKQNGNNPVRVVLDRNLRLPQDLNLFDRSVPTLVCNVMKGFHYESLEYVKVNFGADLVSHILEVLYQRNLQSVIVEGGSQLLDSFIESGLWDEARVFTGSVKFASGLHAPVVSKEPSLIEQIGDDELYYYKNII